MALKVEANSKGSKRKQRYLPHNKSMKKYPLTPGIEGFFITCDGGREHQAAQEALSVIDSYFEDLVDGKSAMENEIKGASVKVSNRKITFTYSNSSDSEADADDGESNRKDDNENEDVNEKDDKKLENVADADDGESNRKDDNENEDVNEKDDKKLENVADDDDGGKSELKEEKPQPKENVHENEQVEQINRDKSEKVEEPPAKK